MENAMDEKEAGRLARLTHKKAEDAAKGAETNESETTEVKGESSKVKVKGADFGPIDLSLVKSDPNKLYPLIYYALKVCRTIRLLQLWLMMMQGVLKEWEEWMDSRPGG